LSLIKNKPQEKVQTRAAGLDLFRFLAALVVFLGHAFFSSEFFQPWSDSPFVHWFRTGTFAVDFFFCLSGYVLAGMRVNVRWILARYARLFPVYLVGVLFGVLTNLLINQNFGSSFIGVCLTIIGIQSFFPLYALAINGPLWSLSVEIILTPIFKIYWVGRNSNLGKAILITVSVGISTVIPSSPLTRAIPFFTLGAILSSFDSIRNPINKQRYNWAIAFFSLFYLMYGSTLILKLDFSLLATIVKLGILTVLIFCLRRIEVGKKTSRVFTFLGKRTFALYAIHGPLVGLFLSALKPNSGLSAALYLFLLLSATIVATEVVYRKVEIPALAWSSKIRNARK
jgi:peptidoglycan/LPS O-acetylase OafA/YrhL